MVVVDTLIQKFYVFNHNYRITKTTKKKVSKKIKDYFHFVYST